MSTAYDRPVIGMTLIDADHNGFPNSNRGALRKKYRLTLSCGHTKEKWTTKHVPSTSRCPECQKAMTAYYAAKVAAL